MKRSVTWLVGLLLIFPALVVAQVPGTVPVTLAWVYSGDESQVDDYRVYQSINGGMTYDQVAVVAPPEKTITLYLQPAQYHFRVTAKNLWGESEPSNVVSTPAGLPAPPSGLTVTIKAVVAAATAIGLFLVLLLSRKK